MLIQKDVCVCGGGPAGWVAALAAAREGAETILIERYGFVGGMATAGLVGPISKFNFSGRRVVGGIPLEFVERMGEAGGAINNLPSGNVPFESEMYKSIALEMLLEAGVEIIFDATVYSAEFALDGTLNLVNVTSAGTDFAVAASLFVDATGSGTLIASRPGLWRKRNTADSNQPLSLIFKLANVRTDQIGVLMSEDGVRYANQELRRELASALSRRLIDNFGGPWAVWGSTIRPGMISVNCTRYGGDVTNPRDLSRAEVVMRSDMLKMVDIFRHADHAFSDAFLLESAVTAGYRESREIVGVYRVKADDIFAATHFEDSIALGSHPVDRHVADSCEQKVQFLHSPYTIPYRCMVSGQCPNLLAVGGLVAAEPLAYATIRVQAQCMAIGQAAGTAAALCAQQQTRVDLIGIPGLREVLRRRRAIIELDNAS